MGNRAPLDLTFVTTGAWQHVFISTDQQQGSWVYKIPAAFGYIVAFNHPRCCFRGNEVYPRTLHLLLLRLPRRLQQKLHQRYGEYTDNRFRQPRPSLLKLIESSLSMPPAWGEKILSRYLKQTTLKHFEKMLGVMEYLSQNGLEDILLPYEISRDGAATLYVEGKTIPYHGLILKQKRADLLFEEGENLESFEWTEMVRAQHRLWRQGVTLRRLHGIFGPRGWALVNGRMRLFDTSGLCKDRRVARHALTRKRLDERERTLFAHALQSKSPTRAAEYFRFMRREINQDKLAQLWQADLRAGTTPKVSQILNDT